MWNSLAGACGVMDEETSVPKQPEVFASDTKQALIGKESRDDVKIARSLLETIPFSCEKEKATFLKRVQCLQDYHIIQIFEHGVAFLKRNLDDSSALLDDAEVRNLFEICLSFCYVTDLSKRVAFDYYARILKFCFSSQSKQCLTTSTVSQILQLVQGFQEGSIGFSDDYRKEINRTKDFFEELFAIFNKRRDEDFIAEIIAQTVRFASADVGNAIQGQSLRGDMVKSHVRFTNWVRLLKVDSVSNRFASVLAKTKALQWEDQHFLGMYVLGPGDSGGLDFVSILDRFKIDDKEVKFPSDEKRLDIYVDRLNHFLEHRSLLVTSLKLFVCTNITNEVFAEVLDQFCGERERLHPHQQDSDSESKKDAFNKVHDVLVSLPDGKLVCDVLRFWRRTFSGDKEYQSLKGLMHLLPEAPPDEDRFCLEERVERVLNYLEWLPTSVQSLISVWYIVFSAMIKLFPTTFDRLPEVLVMIQRASSDAGKSENLWTFIFISSCSVTDVTEEKRKEMIWLFICFLETGCFTSFHDWGIPTAVIQQLSLCDNIPFGTKKRIIRKVTRSVNLFDSDLTYRIINDIFKNISLDPSFRIQIYREMIKVIESGIGKGVFLHGVLEPVRVLLHLVTTVPISGDRRVKILLKAKESDNCLLNSIQILEMSNVECRSKEVNKFFDLFYTAYVDIMKDEKDFCGRFHQQQSRQYLNSSIQVQEIWILEVAKLIYAGSFDEELDFCCCLRVLVSAGKLESAEQLLQLYSQVRESAVKVVQSYRQQDKKQILEKFATPLCIVVGSDSLSSREKLKLVKEVCETSLTDPSMFLNGALQTMLLNLIPPSDAKNSSLYTLEDPVLFELSEIMTALKNPRLMCQVAKCPFLVFKRLSSVFFKASTDKLESIYQFIGTVEQMDSEFFDRAVPVFQTAVEVSNSLRDVMELLREFVFMLRAASTEFVPLFSIVYSHLLKDETKKESRKQFTNDVLKKWTASLNVAVCHNLRVPQLLCKVYNFSESPEKRCEILHRLQEILRKTKNFESPDKNLSKPAEGNIRNRVACCDLEWLVFHSSLSTKEAALAFNLCTQHFQGRLKCFSFSDVEIANGCFKFVPREGGPCTDERTEGIIGRERQALETKTIVFTPALVVEKIIRHLKRVIKEDGHLPENAHSLWRLVCRESSTCATCFSYERSSPFHDSYIEVFLSILSQASSKEIMFYWAELDGHHLCQCSEVILNALKLSTNAFGETDKDALIEFQSLVHKAMEVIRRGQLYNGDDACFVYAVEQLESLCGLLKCGLSIKTISSILTLFQVNERAALAARDIVSEWSNEQQAIELIEALKMRCKDEEMSSLPTQHSIFVWELLTSLRRLFKNSCENLLKELEELVVLYNLGYSHGLGRLPNWRYEMLEHGVPAVAVDCWCIAFLSTPLEELTSHDVDIIVDLDSASLELVPSVSQKIKSCLFPENGFEIALKRKKGIKEPQIKERLRLARLLRELINILKVQKLGEESYGPSIRKVVADTCDDLCEAYVSQETEVVDTCDELCEAYVSQETEVVDTCDELCEAYVSQETEVVDTCDELCEAYVSQETEVVDTCDELCEAYVSQETEVVDTCDELCEAYVSQETEVVDTCDELCEALVSQETEVVDTCDELCEAYVSQETEVVDTCDELCEAYVSQETEEEKGGRENNLYKIREQKLEALFNEIFCYQSRVSYEEPGYTDVSHQLDCKETGTLLPCIRTKSHKNDSLPSILKYTREVYKPLLILLRRWLSGIINKPILSHHVHEIVHFLVSKHSNNDSIQSMHEALQHHIMENNKALVAQLQAVGYNQSEKSSEDLWSSPVIECSGYLTKSELGNEKKNKKLVEVLRNVWNEWKDLLCMQKIRSIKVGDKEIDTRALFGHQLSLEEMEAQVSVVKKVLSQIKSENLQRDVSRMIKKEERHRFRIEEMYKNGKVRIDSWKISAVLLKQYLSLDYTSMIIRLSVTNYAVVDERPNALL